MNSLLDSVKDYLTPDVMRKIGSAAGETPENTKRAMDNIVPTLLFGAAKVADSPGGDNQLMSLINKQTSDGNILSNLAGQLSGESAAQGLMNSGRDAAKALFGGKLNSVIDTLARSLGLKSSSIASLLSIAAPIVLGVLGKERSARGLGASGLASLLSGERNILSQILPAGLGSVLGWGDGGRTEERIADTVGYDPARAAYGTVAREKGTDWWLWPVLGLAALGLLLYSFWLRPAIVPEETVATPEIRQETPAREERTAAVEVPAAVQREPAPVPEEPSVARPDASISQSPSKGGVDVRRVQESLKNQGQNPGPIDGILGSRTHQAIRQFQKENGLQQTGTLDETTLEKLGYNR